MSPTTTPPPATAAALLLNDDDYNSASDDDFDPTVAPASTASDTTPKKRKRRSSSSSAASYASDEGGEGGLIKTRAQKARESHTRPVISPAPSTGSTADVDELWRQMNTKPSTKPATPAPEEGRGSGGETEAKVNVEGEETITISRTYTFAGTTHTELKTVPRSSQEARTYLSSISPNPASASTAAAAAVGTVDPAVPMPRRRPPPKKRASVFDAAAAARKPAVTAQAQKMNTLEKSRLDWAGFVDKEGIGEELKKHTRGDKAYLDRQAFLGRVEESRDRAWKEGQKK